jgi:hypothetical protein
MLTRTWWIVGLFVVLAVPRGTYAQPPEMTPEQARRAVAGAQATWAAEPSAAEVVRAALRYFRLEPDELDSLRTDARLRGIIPIISGDYTYNNNRFASFEAQNPTPLNIDQSSDQIVNGVVGRISWDFRDLVFNGDQINVYGLIGVQRDIMLEVLRAYFARRQLSLTIMLRPPEDPIALASLVLRVEEFTAVLDMLTGEWFSQALAQRRR